MKELKKLRNCLTGVVLAICLFCAVMSVYYARISAYAASPSGEKLSLDQQLSAISINVTILGGIFGLIAVSVGLAALMGWGELRNMLLRKIEDDVLGIIRKLQKSGEINDATASVLAQSIAEDRVFIVSHRSNDATPQIRSETGTTPDTSVGFEKYPGKE